MIDPMPMFKRHIANLQEKSNNQWTGLCPYHNDTKNSFSINAETGQWNCFACGVDGNAITFAKDKGENWKDYISDDYKAVLCGPPKERLRLFSLIYFNLPFFGQAGP